MRDFFRQLGARRVACLDPLSGAMRTSAPPVSNHYTTLENSAGNARTIAIPIVRQEVVAHATVSAFVHHWPERATAEMIALLEESQIIKQTEISRWLTQRRIAIAKLSAAVHHATQGVTQLDSLVPKDSRLMLYRNHLSDYPSIEVQDLLDTATHSPTLELAQCVV